MQFQFHDKIIKVNMPSRTELMTEIHQRFEAGKGFALATVNLDHLVKMRASPEFTAAYAAQDLVVADGWPIVRLAQLAGCSIELMPGSDMVLPLCELAAEADVRIGFVGSTPEALEAAKDALQIKVPGLDVAYIHAPPMGFDPDNAAAGAILQDLTDQNISLCFLALGAPKQEAFAARGRRDAPSVGFASIGAGLDFLSGRQTRAPRWVRRVGMEWLWRALSNPLRLGPRYAKCLAILPAEAIKAWRLSRTPPRT